MISEDIIIIKEFIFTIQITETNSRARLSCSFLRPSHSKVI